VKKIVRPLVAGAGITGALAAANRALSNAPLPTNALGGTQRAWNWRGHQIFATEAGSGPLLLLVHGIYAGASSYEYRKLFPLLARRHRVVAFDLIGCGLSDKPRIAYNTELFVEQLVDAFDAFGETPVGIVASSLGAAFAIRALARDGDRVERLAAICPTGLAGALDSESRKTNAAITTLFGIPVLGEAAFNAVASKASIRRFLAHQAYADRDRATADVVDHYYAVTHQPGARFVPAAFIGGRLNCDVARDLPFLTVPVQLLWGERASRSSPRANADEFLRLARDGRLVTFSGSGLLPHEEEPEAVDAALEGFFSPSAALPAHEPAR
jgi:pimeloyl-ACP methyl ester carboxylesterase